MEKLKYEKLDKIIAYFSDRTYWLKKYNKQKLTNSKDRKAYARSLLKAGEEISELHSDVEYYKSRAEIRLNYIMKQREQLREKDATIMQLKNILKQLKEKNEELRGDNNV